MDREEDESRSGEPQLAADATEEQIAIYQAVLAFYRSDLESQALKEFTRPKAREYAHTIADELGIYHRSEGKGRLRHVVLAKTAPTSPSARYDVDSSTWKPYTYTSGDEELVKDELIQRGELRCLTLNVLHDPQFGPEEAEFAASKQGDTAIDAPAKPVQSSEPYHDPSWPALRTPACFKFLESRRPHVITLNEVSASFFADLLKEPWMQSYWVSDLQMGTQVIGNCILSLFPIRKTVTHKFRMSEKVANMAEIVLPGVDRPPLWVATAHFKAGPFATNGRFRRSQSNEIVSQLRYSASAASPLLIMGDLNIRSSEGEVLQALSTWTDAWELLHPDLPGFTYDPWNNDMAKMASERVCSFDSTRVKMANRYDRILFQGQSMTPVSVDILATEPIGPWPESEDKLYISDHFALEAKFSMTS